MGRDAPRNFFPSDASNLGRTIILMERLMRFELELTAQLKIEDPRGHSPETVRRLRQALASGAAAVPDARRPGFFEIQSDDQVFYIHVSPVTQQITLLATWSSEPELETAHSA
jgi:hypothetical protein